MTTASGMALLDNRRVHYPDIWQTFGGAPGVEGGADITLAQVNTSSVPSSAWRPAVVACACFRTLSRDRWKQRWLLCDCSPLPTHSAAFGDGRRVVQRGLPQDGRSGGTVAVRRLLPRCLEHRREAGGQTCRMRAAGTGLTAIDPAPNAHCHCATSAWSWCTPVPTKFVCSIRGAAG